jgi:hypothetical protein
MIIRKWTRHTGVRRANLAPHQMAARTEKFDPYHQWLGIPPEEQPPSHYRLLGLNDFESDADVISQASDRVMAQIRTFHNGPRAAWAQRLLNELAAARVCLLDARRKEKYDQSLQVKRGIQNLPRRPQAASAAPEQAPPAPGETPPLAPAPRTAVRTLAARRQAKKRTRELISFLLLVAIVIGLALAAWNVIGG